MAQGAALSRDVQRTTRERTVIRSLLLALVLLFPAPALAHAPRPHVPIDLHFGNCPGIEDERILGCWVMQPAGVHHIYQSDHDQLTLPHELGHVFDQTELSANDRESFKAVLGLDVGWWSGRDPPGELFAEAYARCELHYPTNIETSYHYNPTRPQHRAACRVIWNADKVRGNG